MPNVNRREFLGALAGLVFSVRQAVQQPARQTGQVYDPDRAGRPQAPITAADNSAHVQSIEKKLRCTCGCGLDIYTCRTTDFTCTYSPALHQQVLRLTGQGKTPQEVIDAFVAQYGLTALMAPPNRGFNRLAYLGPGLLLAAAAPLVIWMLNNWNRRARPASPEPAAPNASPEELERLRRALERLDG